MTTTYSVSFYGGGALTGTDVVLPMTNSQGKTAAPVLGTGIEPWEPVPITIFGVDIVIFSGGSGVQYAFAGNSYSPDVMRWWGTPQIDGIEFPFPPQSTSQPPHIDCHVGGPPGGNVQLFYTVYYRREGAGIVTPRLTSKLIDDWRNT